MPSWPQGEVFIALAGLKVPYGTRMLPPCPAKTHLEVNTGLLGRVLGVISQNAARGTEKSSSRSAPVGTHTRMHQQQPAIRSRLHERLEQDILGVAGVAQRLNRCEHHIVALVHPRQLLQAARQPRRVSACTR